LIEAYKKYEKHVYRRIEKERAASQDQEHDHSHLEKELEGCIKDLQKELLDIEMEL